MALEEQILALRNSLPAFVDEVADRITEELAPATSPEELTRLINVAINWSLYGGDESTTGSPGLDEAVGQLAEQARAGSRASAGR